MIYRARLMYWAALVCVLFAAFTAGAQEKLKVEAAVIYSHTSNLMTGCPFACEVPENTQDFLAPLAMTITAGKRSAWEIDIAHGRKQIKRGPTEAGSQFNVRYYPGRGRKFR